MTKQSVTRGLSWVTMILAAMLLPVLPAAAQRGGGAAAQAPGGRGAGGGGGRGAEFEPNETDEPPVVTHHTIQLNGKELSYTATVGKMPVHDQNGNLQGHIFYIAYTVDNGSKPNRRPLTFSYNGGPGSAAVWVQMGGFGPRRAAINPDGSIPAPPFHLVDNEGTWLDTTDLVFIDPIGTGYSRAASQEALTAAASVTGDQATMGDFIHSYIMYNDRWNSPLILAGESYGTFRSAALAGYLYNHNIALNGVMLISSVLNLQTISPSPGNDQPYWLALPTLSAIAYYHHKLPSDLQRQTLDQVVQQAEKWAETDYEHDLDLGDALTGAERQKAIDAMARFTGLDKKFLDNWNLRIGTSQFQTELLRDEHKTLGRYDGGQVGTDRVNGALNADYDASDNMGPAVLEMFQQYVRDELGYKSDDTYYGFGGGIPAWNWEARGFGGGYADASGLLQSAMAKNPYMKLYLAEGYYDQATPMFEADYSIKHLFLTPEAQKNITVEHYESGHMVYLRAATRAKLRKDATAFITAASATANAPAPGGGQQK